MREREHERVYLKYPEILKFEKTKIDSANAELRLRTATHGSTEKLCN